MGDPPIRSKRLGDCHRRAKVTNQIKTPNKSLEIKNLKKSLKIKSKSKQEDQRRSSETEEEEEEEEREGDRRESLERSRDGEILREYSRCSSYDRR